MKYLLILCCLFWASQSPLWAQENISGRWTGMLYQEAGGLGSEYVFTLDLLQKGNKITGISQVELSSTVTGKMEVVGELNGTLFTYYEPRIIRETGITDTTAWCLKKCQLYLSRRGDRLYLKGRWSGESSKFGYCSPGTIELSKKVAPLVEKTPPIIIEEEIHETEVLNFRLKVVDKVTGKLLDAALQIGPKGKTSRSKHEVNGGLWESYLDPKIAYQLVVQAKGYYAIDSAFAFDESGDKVMLCRMVAVHKGDVFRMEHLYFEQSKAIITPASDSELEKLFNFMKLNIGVQILISGHTDNVGSSYANKVLSIKRTEAVREYLYNKGIHPARMVCKGYGEEIPIDSNHTADGRAKNRRVEVEILSVYD